MLVPCFPKAIKTRLLKRACEIERYERSVWYKIEPYQEGNLGGNAKSVSYINIWDTLYGS